MLFLCEGAGRAHASRLYDPVSVTKRFGEAQFRTVLTIALVLRKLEDFTVLFKIPDVPASLYLPEPKKPRQRARKQGGVR